MQQLYDIVIIGAGPAGCTAALYAARAKLNVLVLDIPGRSGRLEVATQVENYPGVPGPVMGAELVDTMCRQAKSFGAHFIEEVVNAVQLTTDPKAVYTSEGGAYQARAVIVASGALQREEKVPGEEAFWGRGVSNCTACDAPLYDGKTAIVIGDDDYTAEEALVLSKYAVKVYLMTPTETPVIPPGILAGLRENNRIEVRLGWVLREVVGDTAMRGARFATPEGEVQVAADGVFIYLGGTQASTRYLFGQVPLDTQGAVITNRDQSTALPRVYAAGDVTAGHVRQAVVAASEGCIAALAAQRDVAGHGSIGTDYGSG